MKSFIKGNKGIGLVEILITLGVLAVGILGIAGLNSVITRQSQDNKAEAEALAIAQSRIEDRINYTNQATSQATFDTLFPEITDGNSDITTGVNAIFTRTETVTDIDDDKALEVTVSWTNAEGVDQEVSLNTTVSYVPPRSVGDKALAASPPLVNAPTGRARLGEGTMPENPEELEGYQDNDDGTQEFIEEGDRKLADDEGNVVLTLVDACQSENECLEFVRIKGTVYLNLIPNANQRPDLGNILLLASDAAYCTRYYEDSNGDTQTVEADTDADEVEQVGQEYAAFHYTCYLGGGWHGNIGLLFAGGDNANSNNVGHRACVGDPTTDAEPWRTARVAVRRAYRGMLYKGTADDKEQILNEAEDAYIDRVYTHGILDGVVLGDTIGHDFVIGKIIEPVDVDDNDCDTVDVMLADGSEVNGELGDRFENMPRDFFCLNEGGYLDTYDDEFAPFEGPINGCPYDPTNPPAEKHIIEGTVTFIGDMNDENKSIVDTIGLNTSDGPNTCLIDAFTYSATSYTAGYSCAVYDWTDGWTGYIETTYDNSRMSCSPGTLYYTTAVTDNDNTGNNFANCTPGSFFYVSGALTKTAGSRKLASATLDGVPCTVLPDGMSYNCKSPEFEDTWAGTHTMVLTATSGRLCPNSTSTRTFTYPDPVADSVTQNVWISTNAGGCVGAP